MKDGASYLEIKTAESVASDCLSLEIRKRFDHSQDGFELDVKTVIGSGITIVFGPSGAGKTTLLECTAGLLTPDSGKVSSGNRTLFDSSRNLHVHVRQRRIGYVFQDLALFPHLSVEKNIEYGIHGLPVAERKEKIAQITNSFRISGLRNRKPNGISGGERQRVALARALVTNPSLLLLDEPLTALDSETKSKIIDDLRAWNEAHPIPILYVTHSREEVFALGDHVILLDAGKIIAEGPPRQIFKPHQIS